MNGIHPTSQKRRLLTAEVAGGRNLYTVLETRTQGVFYVPSYPTPGNLPAGGNCTCTFFASTIDNRLMQDPPVQRVHIHSGISAITKNESGHFQENE